MFWHVPMESPKMPKRRGEPEGSPHTRGGHTAMSPDWHGICHDRGEVLRAASPHRCGRRYRTLPHTTAHCYGSPKDAEAAGR